MAGAAPCLRLESFPLRAAVWENERQSAGGKTFKTYSVKLTRAYRDQLGKWQETPTLGDRDLLTAAALLTEVWRTLAVKEGKVAAASQAVADPVAPPVGEENPF